MTIKIKQRELGQLLLQLFYKVIKNILEKLDGKFLLLNNVLQTHNLCGTQTATQTFTVGVQSH